nr:hypothetical protein [Halomonas sp. BC04]
MSPSRLKERLIALIVVATVLFLPPLVMVVDRPPEDGPSWLPLYIFVTWTLVIILAAWLLEQRSGD